MKEKLKRLKAAKQEFEDALNAFDGVSVSLELVPRNFNMAHSFGPWDVDVILKMDLEQIRLEGESE